MGPTEVHLPSDEYALTRGRIRAHPSTNSRERLVRLRGLGRTDVRIKTGRNCHAAGAFSSSAGVGLGC